jgi:hypothetical protein
VLWPAGRRWRRRRVVGEVDFTVVVDGVVASWWRPVGLVGARPGAGRAAACAVPWCRARCWAPAVGTVRPGVAAAGAALLLRVRWCGVARLFQGSAGWSRARFRRRVRRSSGHGVAPVCVGLVGRLGGAVAAVFVVAWRWSCPWAGRVGTARLGGVLAALAGMAWRRPWLVALAGVAWRWLVLPVGRAGAACLGRALAVGVGAAWCCMRPRAGHDVAACLGRFLVPGFFAKCAGAVRQVCALRVLAGVAWRRMRPWAGRGGAACLGRVLASGSLAVCAGAACQVRVLAVVAGVELCAVLVATSGVVREGGVVNGCLVGRHREFRVEAPRAVVVHLVDFVV